jgi:hypothetical protein
MPVRHQPPSASTITMNWTSFHSYPSISVKCLCQSYAADLFEFSQLKMSRWDNDLSIIFQRAMKFSLIRLFQFAINSINVDVLNLFFIGINLDDVMEVFQLLHLSRLVRLSIRDVYWQTLLNVLHLFYHLETFSITYFPSLLQAEYEWIIWCKSLFYSLKSWELMSDIKIFIHNTQALRRRK